MTDSRRPVDAGGDDLEVRFDRLVRSVAEQSIRIERRLAAIEERLARTEFVADSTYVKVEPWRLS